MEPLSKTSAKNFLDAIPTNYHDYQVDVLVKSSEFDWVPNIGPGEDHGNDVMEMDWALCSPDMNDAFCSFCEHRPVLNRIPPFFRQASGHTAD